MLTRSILTGIALVFVSCGSAPENAPSDTQEKQVNAYFRSWTRNEYRVSQIPFEHITHVSHAFVWPDAEGRLVIPDGVPDRQLLDAAHNNDVKVHLSIGGWGHSEAFPIVAENVLIRSRFVAEAVAFCVEHGYDGIDLDWEYPTAAQQDGFIALLFELRNTMQASDPALRLSAAVPAIDEHDGYNVAALSANVDWLNVMAYDFHGAWSTHAGHVAPLFTYQDPQHGSVASSIRHWLEKGMPPHRMNLGIPVFGRRFEARGVLDIHSGVSDVTQQEVKNLASEGWEEHWDRDAYVPYLSSPDGFGFVSYENERSIGLKVDFLLESRLRGAMIWALGQDLDSSGRQPLVGSIGKRLLENQ